MATAGSEPPRNSDALTKEAGLPFDERLLDELPPGVDPCGEHGEFDTFAWGRAGVRTPIDVKVEEVVERDGFAFCDVLPAAPIQ